MYVYTYIIHRNNARLHTEQSL